MEDPVDQVTLEKQNSKSLITKPGVCYISNIPGGMQPISMRQLIEKYGKVGRIYLSPGPNDNGISKQKRKSKNVKYVEGWVEFIDKRDAKKVAGFLNNTNMGTRKRQKFYDCFWNIKYLPNFEWSQIHQPTNVEPGGFSRRKALEMMKTKKEIKFYIKKSDKDAFYDKILSKSQKKKTLPNNQKITTNPSFDSSKPIQNKSSKISSSLLSRIFNTDKPE